MIMTPAPIPSSYLRINKIWRHKPKQTK